MTADIILYPTNAIDKGYVICSLVQYNQQLGQIGGNVMAADSRVLFSHVEIAPIMANINFAFDNIPDAACYFLEIIVSPTMNRTDGQLWISTGFPSGSTGWQCEMNTPDIAPPLGSRVAPFRINVNQ